MNKWRNRSRITRFGMVLAVALALTLAVTARAGDLDFTITPNERSGVTGQAVTFIGFLDNSLGSIAGFVGLDISLPGFDPADITTLFSFADLADGANRSENMFSVYLGPSVATGSYFGTATLSYEYNDGADSGEITQNFRLNVTNIVPEHAAASALLGLSGLAWRKRKR